MRKALAAASPSLLNAIRRVRTDRYVEAHHARIKRVMEAIEASNGLLVRAGPFKGMRYVSRTNWSALPAKLLGVYERELHGVIAEALREPYDVVINIGSAEGYYAIGSALRQPGTRVIAYDLDPVARSLCTEMASLNGVDARVSVKAECTAIELEKVIEGRCLVICDCEGAEFELLDPLVAPALLRSDIVVELHEFMREGVTEEVLGRFRHTHAIRRIAASPAGPELAKDLPLSDEDRLFAVSEFRPNGMEWAVMNVLPRPAL